MDADDKCSANEKHVSDHRLVELTSGKNMLLHGDNELVLNLLAETHESRVKCAYLDPPYNNGESYLHYFDNMGHEKWLSQLTERLKLIKKLLSEDGSLWISIDDSEAHYLKVAADSVFGRDNFASTIVWERRTTRENRTIFSRKHEYILVYCKNIRVWEKTRNALPLTEEVLERYKNPDNDPRGPWQSISANVQGGHGTSSQTYIIKSPTTGKEYAPPKGRCWVYSEERMLREIDNNNIWFGQSGNSAPRIKSFLKDRKKGLTPESLWFASDVGTTAVAKKELKAIFNEEPLFDTPKPEQLMQRILEISTNPGDLVLDPYLGSGTTVAVAQKMQRQYIGIDIGEHIYTHALKRLQKVFNMQNKVLEENVLVTAIEGNEV